MAAEKYKSYGKNSKKQVEEKPVFPMRINKYLAIQKHSTRRGADELIEKGQVFLNGKLAVLGDKVLETDKVEVRFKGKQKPLVYFAYNKPIGIVTHSAQNDDKEIKDQLKEKISTMKSEVALADVFPLGRLDKDSSGLIILTNDGRVTERLLGPAHVHEKEYLVTTKEKLRSSFKEKMEAGVQIDKEKTGKCKVSIIDERTFKVTLTEGKKHQIRRMCSALFQEVQTLTRIRIMNITLNNLRPGEHRPILNDELATFLSSLGL